ncbi:MAG TPA: gfo/Idh/MocA family oxidoreductase, partial [Blastocatellia bacterium]|nr:gfo/Idh/MocA family oxidoreductase [Blastocatellia bacterium]
MKIFIRTFFAFALFAVLMLNNSGKPSAQESVIKIGIIGTDTSHVPAFTKLLNDPKEPGHISGARVVAAFKGGSADVESSYKRVDNYANEIHDKYGVEIVG